MVGLSANETSNESISDAPQPRAFRNVPGRKIGVNDATWIADLLAHGLIRSSFVPPVPIQELRDLTRTRKQLVREISQHSSRLLDIDLGDSTVPGCSEGRASRPTSTEIWKTCLTGSSLLPEAPLH